MPSEKAAVDLPQNLPFPGISEEVIERGLIEKLQSLKYDYRPDIKSRSNLEKNFRE